jgi:hypothetical protein
MSDEVKQGRQGIWEPRYDGPNNSWVLQNRRTLEFAQTVPSGKSAPLTRRFNTKDAALTAAATMNISARAPLDYKVIATWAVGHNVGASPKCIAAHLMGLEASGAFPRTSEDFERCEELLEAIPELRERLPDMASCNRYWAALVPRWETIKSARDKGEMIRSALESVQTSTSTRS